MSSPPPGGFLQHHTLSPAPSSAASSSAVYALPHPRARPLKPGGPKESAFIRYVDDGILQVQRKFAKRDSEAAAVTGDKGYESFGEAGKDIERLLEVIWVSGTPSLQVPYLLSLALITTTFIPGFPPSPKTMFRLLGKLDHAFASLLQGRDVDTGEPLPGSESGNLVSSTHKVRIKSIVERTRLCVIEVMDQRNFEKAAEEEADTENESMADDLEDDFVDEAADWEMEIAKVYDRTIVELGDAIGGPPIGVFGDEEADHVTGT